MLFILSRTHPSHPHMLTADQPSIGDTPRAELICAMQCVSHMHFNGNPSVFQDAEVVLARDVTTLFLPESDSRFLVLFTHIASRVAQMIGWYGDDGYGGKPEDMPRFTYWFQHQDTAKISAIVEHLQERPAKLSIVCMDKPASSAPKCFTCKEKKSANKCRWQRRRDRPRPSRPLRVRRWQAAIALLSALARSHDPPHSSSNRIFAP